jgi:hypothetical protein
LYIADYIIAELRLKKTISEIQCYLSPVLQTLIEKQNIIGFDSWIATRRNLIDLNIKKQYLRKFQLILIFYLVPLLPISLYRAYNQY